MNAVSLHPTIDALEDLGSELLAIRHQLHSHPELSYHEVGTAELVANKLEQWGYRVTRKIGGEGVVATLRCGDGTRSIGVRADMDALPIQEENSFAHRSLNNGVMHACGHDGHTTMLLGAAAQLARTRRFNGTVNLIFQPAEESGFDSGAQRMMKDGLFERFPCDAVFGLHNTPGLAVGHFGFRSGAFMAACDTVIITVRGKSGHAARPHLSVDPVVIAGSLIMALQTVVSRNIDPTQTAVVTIGVLRSGHVANVIPDSARLELSVRSFDPKVRVLLRDRIEALAHQQSASFGGEAEVEYKEGYPVLVNAERETDFAAEVARELFGAEKVITPYELIAGSEDFAYFLQQRPGCFLRLGNGATPSVHNSRYDFNDSSILIGAAYWTRLVERYLAEFSAP
jgi:hippurate hydrolase